MFLDERKYRILKTIIDLYIETAEPVGSRSIAKKDGLGLSSATIRNEMADLEEMGYLEQPHASAGRVPSDKGYRLYVDHMLSVKGLTIEELEYISREMDIKIGEISHLIKRAATVMANFTKYTSVVSAPVIHNILLKALQVVPIDTGTALVVVVTNTGTVKNNLVKIPKDTQPDYIIKVSNILGQKLAGITASEVSMKLIKELSDVEGITLSILVPIIKGVIECVRQTDENQFIIGGTANIFEFPEFHDIYRARKFLSLIEEEEFIKKSIVDDEIGEDVKVNIGSENTEDQLRNVSIITANYTVGDNNVGKIGIIGPTRMDYGKAISSLMVIRDIINNEIKKLIGDI